MGGVILIVAYNLIDFKHIRQIIRYSRSETAILATTFFATLFLELEFAIYLGVLLSLIIFLARTSTPYIPELSIDEDRKTGARKFINVEKKPIASCPQLKVIRIDMSIYFGSVDYIQNRIQKIREKEGIKHILIIGSGINFIDLAGAEALVSEHNRLKSEGGGLYFVGIKSSVYEFIARTCFVSKIGNNNFFDSKKDALRSIYKRLDKEACGRCDVRIFHECQTEFGKKP
jgi:SulP family sulfate permease